MNPFRRDESADGDDKEPPETAVSDDGPPSPESWQCFVCGAPVDGLMGLQSHLTPPLCSLAAPPEPSNRRAIILSLFPQLTSAAPPPSPPMFPLQPSIASSSPALMLPWSIGPPGVESQVTHDPQPTPAASSCDPPPPSPLVHNYYCMTCAAPFEDAMPYMRHVMQFPRCCQRFSHCPSRFLAAPVGDSSNQPLGVKGAFDRDKDVPKRRFVMPPIIDNLQRPSALAQPEAEEAHGDEVLLQEEAEVALAQPEAEEADYEVLQQEEAEVALGQPPEAEEAHDYEILQQEEAEVALSQPPEAEEAHDYEILQQEEAEVALAQPEAEEADYEVLQWPNDEVLHNEDGNVMIFQMDDLDKPRRFCQECGDHFANELQLDEHIRNSHNAVFPDVERG